MTSSGSTAAVKLLPQTRVLSPRIRRGRRAVDRGPVPPAPRCVAGVRVLVDHAEHAAADGGKRGAGRLRVGRRGLPRRVAGVARGAGDGRRAGRRAAAGRGGVLGRDRRPPRPPAGPGAHQRLAPVVPGIAARPSRRPRPAGVVAAAGARFRLGRRRRRGTGRSAAGPAAGRRVPAEGAARHRGVCHDPLCRPASRRRACAPDRVRAGRCHVSRTRVGARRRIRRRSHHRRRAVALPPRQPRARRRFRRQHAVVAPRRPVRPLWSMCAAKSSPTAS